MPNMDYFRRPLLAGKNVSRMALASIRGSVRRHDADGINPFPYFTGAIAAQTLNLKVDGVVYNVTITGPGINTIIADINAVLLANGAAFDADGTLGIRTSVGGATGSVEVTGGTAAVFLGFDVSNGRIRAVNGDIISSPEGRVGNWMGVSFPNKGENFTTESLTRSMARLSGNADVLYADDSRSDAVVVKLAFSTSDQRLLTVSTVTSKLFTGLGLLSSASTKEDLSPYFQMVDTVTKQIAKSRVVGVVRGAVVGLPPYANATAWTGGGAAIGNVLGVDLAKVPSVAITDIRNGRIIQSTGADFTDVVAGDFVNISGATNTAAWDNNGYKWVVEEVISTTVLAVRPMSKSELTLVGTTLNNEQPILELNTTKAGIEVFGNITVKTGSFCSNVNVIVDPPIPTGATYELWASVGGSLRSNAPSSIRNALSPVYRDSVSNYNPVENGTLSGLVASQSGPNCVVTTGLLRYHGKVFSIPARTFLPGEFVDGSNYLYWDEATGNYAITLLTTPWASVHDPASLTNKGHLIAIVVRAAGVITQVIPITKVRGENSVSVTVGIGGQFATLEAASLWAQGLSGNYSESVSGSAAGFYPHFDFVVVSDITLVNIVPFGNLPSVTLRGATELVKLTMSSLYFSFTGDRIEIRDFRVSCGNDINYFLRIIGATPTTKVIIKNINHYQGNFWSIVETTGTGTLNEAQVLDCNFRLSRSIVRGIGTGGRGVDSVRVLRSKFTHVASLAPHLICHGTSPATPWDGDLLVIQDCDFLGSWGSAAGADADPMLVNEAGTHPTVPSQMVFQNIRLSLGNYQSAIGSSLIQSPSANCVISNLHITAGKIPVAVNGGTLTAIRDSKFRVNTNAAGLWAVQAGYVGNCTLLHVDSDATANGGEGIRVLGRVVNCTIGPYFKYGVVVSGSGIREISGNNIYSVAGGFAEDLDSCIYLNGTDNCRITNNTISPGAQIAGTGLGYGVRLTGTNTNVTIANNKFTLTTQGTSVGSTSGTNSKFIIANNTVFSPDSVSEQGMDVSRITEGTVIGNSVQMTGGAGSVALRSGTATANLRIANNYLEADTAFTNAGTNLLIYEGNHFVGFVTNVFGVATGNVFTATANGFGVTNIKGQVCQNNFNFVAPATAHSVTNISGRFEGNLVSTNVTVGGTGQEVSLEFIGNSVGGNFSGTNAFTSAHVVGNSFNVAGSGTVTVNTTGIWSFADNYASGAVSLTVSEAYLSNDRFAGTVTVVSGVCHVSSCLFGTTVVTASSSGFLTSSSLGSVTLDLADGTVSACKLAGGSIVSGSVTGCWIGTASEFFLGTNSASFDQLVFSGNTCHNTLLRVNPGTNQPVVISGNHIQTQVTAPGGAADFMCIDVQRGSGILITGNTIYGPALGVEVGSAARVSHCTISNNYIQCQRGDYSSASQTMSAADTGAGGAGAGTYQFLAIFRFSMGGASTNDHIYSVSALSNAVTIAASHQITLSLNPGIAVVHGGLSSIGFELWKTANAGATWQLLTTTTFSGSGPATANYNGEAGATNTPGMLTTLNNSGNRPTIRCKNSFAVRILGNLMFKKTTVGDDNTSFIVVTDNGQDTLIGNNNFSGSALGLTDDGNTGAGDDDTYWTANPTTTYAASGNVGSGGTRE